VTFINFFSFLRLFCIYLEDHCQGYQNKSLSTDPFSSLKIVRLFYLKFADSQPCDFSCAPKRRGIAGIDFWEKNIYRAIKMVSQILPPLLKNEVPKKAKIRKFLKKFWNNF
jgi:hypothetical protein